MKTEWLVNEGHSNLILFFAGWGMDPNPFKSIKSDESDVLMFFDYRDSAITFPMATLYGKYDSIKLLAWSLGVPIAGAWLSQGPIIKPEKAVALNGSAYPAHDDFGIPPSLYDATIDALSDGSLKKFYKRMCQPREVQDQFMSTAPQRLLQDLEEELRILRNVDNCPDGVFQRALVSEDDAIVPPHNQVKCWEKAGVPVTNIQGSHFPFYIYSSWEALLEAES